MSKISMTWTPQAAQKKFNDVVLGTLWRAGQDAITQAMNDVPLDTGTLRRSGTVTVGYLPDAKSVYSQSQNSSGNNGSTIGKRVPSVSQSTREAVVYVSYNTPYAIWLHETKTWKPRDWKLTAAGHKVPKPAVGRWKWLANALPKVKKRWALYVAGAKREAGMTP